MNDPYRKSPLQNQHSALNGVFVYEMYGPVQPYGRDALRISQAEYTIWDVP